MSEEGPKRDRATQGGMCHSVADAERISSPLSNHDPRSPARSLDCLV